MAVQLRAQGVGGLAYPFYTALSDDLKPCPSVDNATLYELDTGRTFVWCSDCWWPLATPPQAQPAAAAGGASDTAAVCAALGEVLAELRALRAGMVEAGTAKEI